MIVYNVWVYSKTYGIGNSYILCKSCNQITAVRQQQIWEYERGRCCWITAYEESLPI